MALGKFASDFGKGLLAGLIGTVAITVSQTIEAKIRDRAPSTAPADAAGKALGVQPTGDAEKTRFSNIVHFGYGTLWGGVRGLLDAAGLPRAAAVPVHLALVQGTAMVMLPGLKVAPPISEWGATEIGTEALHHLVYALATDAAYTWLSRDE